MASPQRLFGPLLLAVLAAGVVFAIFVSNRQAQQAASISAAQRQMVTVSGVAGSEKIPFLTDPQVVDALRKHDIDLHVEAVGSREMATRGDLKTYDFAFPAGVPGARKIMQVTGVKKSYSPFFTPMIIASWRPIANILAANGVVRMTGPSYGTIDMKRLLDLMQSSTRWKDLKSSGAFAIEKTVLVSSTDVRTSNSAAMYLALTAYVLNGDNVVQNDGQVRKVLPAASQLFLRQGYQESSSAGPFEDYTSMGMGKAPMVMAYEAQFVEYQLEHAGNRNGDMVLLYPDPTIFTKHVFIPFDEKGDKLGDLLQNDPELQRLAVEHGLRTADTSYVQTYWKQHGIAVPATLINVVDPPSFEVLESMIRDIAAQEQNAQLRPEASQS